MPRSPPVTSAKPVHVAAARFDPVVPPPGQFAVYNALPGDRRLFVLDAGHFDYPRRRTQATELLSQLWAFFAPSVSRGSRPVHPGLDGHPIATFVR
jgi:pimeloyl-ACP methyl ester carboxylesterase